MKTCLSVLIIIIVGMAAAGWLATANLPPESYFAVVWAVLSLTVFGLLSLAGWIPLFARIILAALFPLGFGIYILTFFVGKGPRSD
jgi:hypothetical protein